MLVAAFGGLLLPLVVTALIAVTGTTTRYALGRDLASLKSGPTPGVPVTAAERPVLFLNPLSGGGKVERLGLAEQARRRGIEAIVLAPGDDVARLAREMLPPMLGPDATPFDLRFTGPDGTESETAHLILVSNNRYELRGGGGFVSRRRIDAGILGNPRRGSARPTTSHGSWRHRDPAGRDARAGGPEWSDSSFEVRSSDPVEVGIDGEALRVDPPVRFRIVPGALRVRTPRDVPGPDSLPGRQQVFSGDRAVPG